MGKELVISSNRHETKVAILEDDQLVEIYFQRANEYSLAGSIHKGRVTRVLPGMQSAFVDIGLERDAFLYVSDFFEEHEEYDKIAAPPPETRPRRVEPSQPPPPVAVQAESRPVVAAPAERGPEPDNRDGKGRRSRRRRSRGRGFPDSKYAPEPVAWSRPEGLVAAAGAADTVSPPAAETPSSPAADFMVLPGESLAKYRPDAPHTEPEAGVQAELEAIETEGVESVPAVEAQPWSEHAAIESSTPEEQQIDSAVEPDGLPVTETSATRTAVARAVVETPPVESLPAAVEAEPEPEPENGTWREEEMEAVLEQVEAGMSGPSVEDAPETPEQLQQAGAAGETAGPGQVAEPATGLTADVRERGSRFPHRVSRRLRRKMRGPAPAEEAKPEYQEAEPAPRAQAQERTVTAPEKAALSIADLLREGQEILVQIAKEPLGLKGARITSHIALPGRYVVYMPTVEHLGVSRKIASDEERMRLKQILQTHRVGISGGFIVRTAGTGKSEKEIAADMMFLYNLWLDMRQKAEKKKAPALVHHDLDLVQRLLRDQISEGFKAIWVDSEEVYERVLQFIERMQPGMVSRVKMYTRPAPIFDAFDITNELEKALRPKVWLKSGGYIVVNQTEALVAIDVNTGKFVGKSAKLEDTIVRTNTEAIKEIVRQIRLRDLGGIIVIDFIDMDERKNRQKVMQVLEDEMRGDRAPNKILQFNDFGLVAITRKRVKQSLERALCSPCPSCEGSGYVKSVQTVIGEILQEAGKIAPAIEGPNVVLRVHPDVAKALKSTDNDYLEELEEILRRPVLVTGDPELHPEKFDLA